MKRVYKVGEGMDRRLLYSEKRIADEVQRLAKEISSSYAGEELLMVVVLKGAFFFAADLARQVQLPLTLDFIKLSSYSGMESTGRVTIAKDLETSIAGKHVLVVEDIIDTGLTLAFLLERLWEREPKSLKVCTLIDKQERRRVEVTADYVGIACKGGFLVGYGLDLDEKMRELSQIYEFIQ